MITAGYAEVSVYNRGLWSAASLAPFIARGMGACPLSAFCARVHGAVYSPLTPSLYGLKMTI